MKSKGFQAPCIRCGETNSLLVCLDNVTQFSCCSCDAEFTADDVYAIIRGWAAVLAWLDTCPERED